MTIDLGTTVAKASGAELVATLIADNGAKLGDLTDIDILASLAKQINLRERELR